MGEMKKRVLMIYQNPAADGAVSVSQEEWEKYFKADYLKFQAETYACDEDYYDEFFRLLGDECILHEEIETSLTSWTPLCMKRSILCSSAEGLYHKGNYLFDYSPLKIRVGRKEEQFL